MDNSFFLFVVGLITIVIATCTPGNTPPVTPGRTTEEKDVCRESARSGLLLLPVRR